MIYRFEENDRSGSSSKHSIKNEFLQKGVGDLNSPNGIAKPFSMRKVDVGEMPQKVSAETHKKGYLKRYKPKITLRTSHVWLHHVKGNNLNLKL